MSNAQLVLEFAAAPLTDADEFAAWIVASNLLTAAPFVSDAHCEDACVLRDALSRAMKSVAGGDPLPARDAATLNSFADEDPPRLALRSEGGLARTAPTPVPAALSVIARAAIELLATRAADLRLCEADGCGQAFLDDSRGRRRRWCSMTRCGNRAKVLAFRERRTGAPTRTPAR